MLCDRHNVELRFVESEEVNELLGRKLDSDWVEDFERLFPRTDMEVIGTLGVLLALHSVAIKENAQAAVLGLNLEDLLAECLLRLMQGRLPLSLPVRRIDELAFWYPLYRVPKKLLDGCYPKFSLRNYLDRYPSRMLGRAIPYYVAQMCSQILPGLEFDLLRGFEDLSKQNDQSAPVDPDLGFATASELSRELKTKWQLYTQA